jgi:multiple sugar transport system permease protein
MDTQSPSTESSASPWYQSRRVWQAVRLGIVYILLAAGAIFSLFPLAWMVSASLKPNWQVAMQPVIWIPQKWHQVEADHTGRTFGIWRVKQGRKSIEVAKIATSRYSTVVDVEDLHSLYSVPEDQVSSPRPTIVQGNELSVRTANIAGKTREVIALARDGTNLIVADLADLHEFAFVAQRVLYPSAKADVVIDGISLQVDIVSINAVDRRVVPSGGGKAFSTVLPLEALSNAQLVRSERLQPLGVRRIGEHDMNIYELAGGDRSSQLVSLTDERCNPIVPYDVIQHAFAVSSKELIGDPTLRSYGNAELEVQRAVGGEQEVAILKKGAGTTLVVELQFVHDVQIACAGQLSELRPEVIMDVALPIKDDYEGPDGRISQVAVVGESRSMATVITTDAASAAFDVPDDSLKRASTPSLRWESYVAALSTRIGNASYLVFFFNTAVLVILNIIGSLLSCTVVAYGFARLHAPGKSVLFIILLATLMLPFPVTMIPLYEIFVRAGEFTQGLGIFKIGQDTLWPLFLPAFFGDAFIIFLMRQFFMTIPVELEDAARIDGANRLQILWYVLIPLIKPALATAAIFNFMWVWNDFMGPLIYLDSPHNFTVTLALSFFKGQFRADYPMLMAASIVALLPMALLFFFAQRFFIEGITMTGLKG